MLKGPKQHLRWKCRRFWGLSNLQLNLGFVTFCLQGYALTRQTFPSWKEWVALQVMTRGSIFRVLGTRKALLNLLLVSIAIVLCWGGEKADGGCASGRAGVCRGAGSICGMAGDRR